MHSPKPTMMPQTPAALPARFHQMPSTRPAKRPAAAIEKAQDTRNRMFRAERAGHIGREDGDDRQEHAADDQAALGVGVGIDHLVVDVVAQRVCDRQQQPVSGRKRGGETAGGDQARDDVWQAGDFRRRQNDSIGMQAELRELQDAVGIAGDALAEREGLRGIGRVAGTGKTDAAPRRHPGWKTARSAGR